MTPEEEQEALAVLKQSDLIDQILKDFTASGTVGEETNKLVGYLCTPSPGNWMTLWPCLS